MFCHVLVVRMTNPMRRTCKHDKSYGQVATSVDRLEFALIEKARVARVTRMRLAADVTEAALAEMLATSTTLLAKWRNADMRESPTIVSLLLADDDVCDVMLHEIAAARVRLGHSARHWSADETRGPDQSAALEQALERALALVRGSRSR